MTFRFLPLLALALVFAACSTTEEAAEDAADTTENVAEATVDVAQDAADTADTAVDEGSDAAEDAVEIAAGTVADAAGTVYGSVRDLFTSDPSATAAALVRPTSASGAQAQGTVRFHETDDGLMVMVSLRGLAPGRHGLHIHQNAECGPSADGTPAGAAGGHWDPHGTEDHGAPSEDPMDDKHLGDLGNITASADGTAETTLTIDAYNPGEHDVSGHALVVHSGMDDLETDPAGDAGTRMGCGVIMSRM